MSLFELLKEDLEEPRKIKFYGWIRRIRVGGGGSLIFIDIYDGTCVGDLKCIISKEEYLGNKFVSQDELTDFELFKDLSFEQLLKTEFLSDGCAVVVNGILVKSPDSAIQKFELQIQRLRVIGGVDNPCKYPIQKSSEKQLITLRQLPFMRIRSQAMQSIFRICSKLELGIHIFMDEHNVQKIDPNIITMSDCEGAGEIFTISPLIFSHQVPVGLTVSSQLPLESAICVLWSLSLLE
jgi:asparaginyl-tRNA synthetase